MSAGSLSAIGSLATGQLQQARSADGERVVQDAQGQSRSESSRRQAENAAGIGEMGHDEASSERDADGRRLWEAPMGRTESPSDASGSYEPPRSRDARGEAGTHLDLDG